ncbi:hypothetical protein C8R45DRAFT_933731 [Mycena sanguinolenta]|nr:hypothetical protein C8R45DRAFT_933731 [Mycena sanguinolenta]
MQFNIVCVVTALLASASLAISATITGWSGPDCTGNEGESSSVPLGECFNLDGSPAKSLNYSDVPNHIEFFFSAGGSDSCIIPALVLGPGSGCGTAPSEFSVIPPVAAVVLGVRSWERLTWSVRPGLLSKAGEIPVSGASLCCGHPINLCVCSGHLGIISSQHRIIGNR